MGTTAYALIETKIQIWQKKRKRKTFFFFFFFEWFPDFPPKQKIKNHPTLQIPLTFSTSTSQIHTFTTTMEAIAFSDHNKENIPPFSTKKQTDPVSATAPSSKKTNKRRPRKPLADITNLFYDSVQQSGFLLLSPSASLSASNPRKRKLATRNIGSTQVTSSKSLRMGFR